MASALLTRAEHIASDRSFAPSSISAANRFCLRSLNADRKASAAANLKDRAVLPCRLFGRRLSDSVRCLRKSDLLLRPGPAATSETRQIFP